jgi:hypothetical protein
MASILKEDTLLAVKKKTRDAQLATILAMLAKEYGEFLWEKRTNEPECAKGAAELPEAWATT